MSLRLGALCAVIDDRGCVLLSRRGDLNLWSLPGGRLDPKERLEDAAAREVLEETGLRVQVEHPVGLFYLDGWQRLNVLYAAFPLGGKLLEKTRETRANRYFTSGALPQGVIGAKEAVAETRPLPRVITWSRRDSWRLRLRFGWRWLINRASGHPEPKFPQFNVRAVAVVYGDSGRRVLTLPGLPGPGYNPADTALGPRALPRVTCDGAAPPWEQLAQFIQRVIAFRPTLQWVGLWQDAERGMFEFVFAALVSESELSGSSKWTTTRNAAFSDRDMAYVERTRATFARDPIWTITAREVPSDIVFTPDKEARL